MEFEFDAAKSMSNLAKHGISFDEAKKLWSDPKRLVISARETTELILIDVPSCKGWGYTADTLKGQRK